MMGRALTTRGDGKAVLAERPPLKPGPGEVLVAPQLVGICATDVELVNGQVDPAFVRYPLVIGHEWVGMAVSTSPGLEPGDLVVVDGIVPCWRCDQCRAGATNLCETYDEVGFTRDGAAADEVVVPAGLVHRLPAGTALEDAVLVEPTSVVYHGLARVQPRPGLDCLVVGDGTIALLALQLLRLWSPASVTLVARRPEQAALAQAAGADEVLADAPHHGFDLVVEAAGANEAVLSALAAARRGATVVLFGLPPHGSVAPVAIDQLVNGDITVRASFSYSTWAFSRALRLIAGGQLHPGSIVTHRFDLEDHAEAMRLLQEARPGEARGKVVLRVRR
jgi:L-iditol 2-dehydrogenase